MNEKEIMEQKVTKIKILNIHDYPPKEGGGVEVNTYEACKQLVALGYDVTIATSRLTSETTKGDDVTNADGIRVVLLTTVAQLENLIEETDITHIHFTFSFRPASMLALKICVEKNKPCVFAFRTLAEHIPFSASFTDVSLERDRKLNELKQNISAPNVFLSGPAENVNETLKKLGIDKKIQVIKNGCTTLKYDQCTDLDIKKVDMTYIGELSFLKGINYLIDAVRILNKSGKNLTLRLVGGGSDELEMKRLVSYHKLEKNVEFTGYIKNADIGCYLKETEFYVHPSLTECWSNAIVEALSMGVPVICTDVAGAEITNNGEFAILAESANAEDLAKKIAYAFDNENILQEKSRAQKAMRFIRQKYTFENQAKQLARFYRNVLQT